MATPPPPADLSVLDTSEDPLDHLASSPPPVHKSRLANLFVNHTKKTCALACFIPFIAVIVIVVTRAFTLDDPVGGDYFVRDDIRTRLDNARSAAREEFPFEQQEDKTKDPPREQERFGFSFTVLTRGKLPNSGKVATSNNNAGAPTVLTPQVFALHKQAEDSLLNASRFSDYCLYDPQQRDCSGKVPICARPESFLNHPLLYGIVKDGQLCGRRPGHEPVSQQNFDKFINLIFNKSQAVIPAYTINFGKDLTSTSRSTWIMQTHVLVGQPFANFSSLSDRRNEQEEAYIKWALPLVDTVEDISTDTHKVFAISDVAGNASFGDIAIRDLSFSVAAIVLVFLVIWIHTSSAFLAMSAMSQIFLAFPLAYIFYHFVLRQLYFAALQILAIFLLLGIGADDVFVFTDAWKQAVVVLGHDVDLVTRMSWTYRRAVKAMTVTSVTTTAAFFVTAVNPIMPISTLGIWAALLILLQFFLVITIYPCATIIWHRFWRPRQFIRCFMKPPPEIAEVEMNTPLWHRFLPKKMRPEVKVGSTEYRAIERFFRGPWIKLIGRVRFILLGLGVVLVGVSIWLATGLQPPTEEESFLPADHPIEEAFNVQKDAFPSGDAYYQLEVRVTWGVKDVDRSGTSKFDVKEVGKVILDDSFDFRTAAAQRQVLKACDIFGKNESLIFQNMTKGKPVECWIESYKDWRKTEEKKTEDFEDFSNSKDQVNELIKFAEFKDSEGNKPYRRFFDTQMIAFDKKRTRVMFTEVRFVAAVEEQVPYKIMWPIYNDWIGVLKKLNAEGPKGANKAIATGGYSWMFQITQRTLVRSMFVGIGVMLVVAVVVLTIATMNWLVAVLATVCITGILATLLGVIRLLGWELGITESVGVVISVGYSFDYVAHIATAYVESRSTTRDERTRDALTDLGVSIFFGAVSTLLAGFMLFPAIITFFVKFAGLIVTTVILSLTWALCFFPALLLIAGPNEQLGSLGPLVQRVFCCFRRKDDKGEGKESTDTEERTSADAPREEHVAA